MGRNSHACNKRDVQHKPKIVRVKLKECYNILGTESNEINFNHCVLSNNTLQNRRGTLLDFYISVSTEDPWINIQKNLVISILYCVFHNNRNFQLIKMVSSKNDYGFVATPKLIIEHVKISNLNLTKGSYLMYFSDIKVYLKGPVIIKYIESYSDKFAIINTPGPLSLQFENYVEISYCTIPIAFKISCVCIAENATVNFTSNTFDTLIFNKEYQSYPESLLSSPRMLKPCIFQYSSSRGNLDKEFKDGEN